MIASVLEWLPVTLTLALLIVSFALERHAKKWRNEALALRDKTVQINNQTYSHRVAASVDLENARRMLNEAQNLYNLMNNYPPPVVQQARGMGGPVGPAAHPQPPIPPVSGNWAPNAPLGHPVGMARARAMAQQQRSITAIPGVDPPPDEDESVIVTGYKLMRIDEASPSVVRLVSPVQRMEWAGPELTATCKFWPIPQGEEHLMYEHAEQHLRMARTDHNCGIYAYRSWDDAVDDCVEGNRAAKMRAFAYGEPSSSFVIVEVAIWGLVVEHDKGYRAEHARVERIFASPKIGKTFIYSNSIHELRERYRAPVITIPDLEVT